MPLTLDQLYRLADIGREAFEGKRPMSDLAEAQASLGLPSHLAATCGTEAEVVAAMNEQAGAPIQH